MSFGMNGKRGALAASGTFFLILLMQLSTLASHSDRQINVTASFLCSEVGKNNILTDEETEVVLPSGCFLPSSLRLAAFSAIHVAQVVDDKKQTTASECFYNFTIQLEYLYDVIKLDKFLANTCEMLSSQGYSSCYREAKTVVDTYEISPIGYKCRIKVNLTRNFVQECSDYKVSHRVCTAQRTNATETFKIGSCGLRGSLKYTQKIEVLYNKRLGLLDRLFSSLDSNAFEVKSGSVTIRSWESFCDLILLDALKLMPHYTGPSFRFVVLLRFQVSNGTTNMEAHKKVVRVVREQHMLHVIDCNRNETLPDSVWFYFRNFTNRNKSCKFVKLPRSERNNDYYSEDSWNTLQNELNMSCRSAVNYIKYSGSNSTCMFGVHGGSSSWTKILCRELKRDAKATKKEGAGLIVRFNVTTHDVVPRNWTFDVLLAYLYNFCPSSDKEVVCDQPNKLFERIQIPVTEDYYKEYHSKKHFIKDHEGTFLYSNNLEYRKNNKLSNAWRNATVTFEKVPVERANGPQFQWFANVDLSWDALCNYSLLSYTNRTSNTTIDTFYIRLEVNRQEENESLVNLSVVTYYFRRPVNYLFKADYFYHEVNCEERFDLSYWHKVSNFTSEKVLFSSSNAIKAHYCWNTSGGNVVCKNARKVPIFSYVPSFSANLTKFVTNLCKLLQHYPTALFAQAINVTESKNIRAEFEYTTTRNCTLDDCRTESIIGQLKLKVREYEPWIFELFSCTKDFQSVEFDFNSVFAQHKSSDKIDFLFNETKTRYCKNEKPVSWFMAFTQYFGDDCFEQVEELQWELTSVGSKQMISFNKTRLCDTISKNKNNKTVTLAFLKVSFHRNSLVADEKVLLVGYVENKTKIWRRPGWIPITTRWEQRSLKSESDLRTNKVSTWHSATSSESAVIRLKSQVSEQTEEFEQDDYGAASQNVEQVEESEPIIAYRNALVLVPIPESNRKVEPGPTPDVRIGQWATLSIGALAFVVLLVFVVFGHYMYSMTRWKRKQNDGETQSGQHMYETGPSEYAASAWPGMETVDVNAIVDQVMNQLNISNCYASHPVEQKEQIEKKEPEEKKVVDLDSQFRCKSTRKKDNALQSRRHVSFSLDNMKQQHSTSKITPHSLEEPEDPQPEEPERFAGNKVGFYRKQEVKQLDNDEFLKTLEARQPEVQEEVEEIKIEFDKKLDAKPSENDELPVLNKGALLPGKSSRSCVSFFHCPD